MAVEGKITKFLNKRSWIIIVLFGSMIAILAIAIAAFETRRIAVELGQVAPLNTDFSFSIGGEICAMFVAIMMTISILPSFKRNSGYIRIFVTLLTIGCFCLLFDTLQMLSDGVPNLIMVNKVLCILVFMNEVGYLFFFYLYATYALESEGKKIQTLNLIMFSALGVFLLLPLVNFFYPLYFTIGENGVYARNQATWWICRIFLVLTVISTVIAIILSKVNKRKKIIISVFIALPVISIGAGGFKYGVSLLYTSMMVSLVLIYAFLFSDHERNLYTKSKELNLATNIQNSMLPSIFPAFPERKEFDIYASMQPAKEVGGDFYDFFLIDEDHLGMVIADVSDKGVPAALFMMASKIMVQNSALLNISPKNVLATVNKQICSNNQAEMFVTIWLGILNLKTGLLTASNAGHEKPIIKKPDGHFEIIKDVHGFVVGWDKGATYKNYEIQLEKGSKIFLYTDGVPEASNADGKFGREKTLETIRKYEDESPNEILRGMQKELANFTGNFPQFDDITMLCLEYHGSDEKTKDLSYTFPAELKKLDDMINPILNSLKEIEIDEKVIYKVHLAMEEILTNICSYGYGDKQGDITIKSHLSFEPKEITITVIDSGKEFNPLEKEEPDLEEKLSKREIGGLGIFITKNIMDELSYSREDNKNILTMKKKF